MEKCTYLKYRQSGMFARRPGPPKVGPVQYPICGTHNKVIHTKKGSKGSQLVPLFRPPWWAVKELRELGVCDMIWGTKCGRAGMGSVPSRQRPRSVSCRPGVDCVTVVGVLSCPRSASGLCRSPAPIEVRPRPLSLVGTRVQLKSGRRCNNTNPSNGNTVDEHTIFVL